MSVVYGQLAAKQAAAKIMAAAGKRQYEYDSDEETEGGNSWLVYSIGIYIFYQISECFSLSTFFICLFIPIFFPSILLFSSFFKCFS